MKKMVIIFFAGFIVGGVISGLSVWLIMRGKPLPEAGLRTVIISGDGEIQHKDLKLTGKTIKFKTIAKGETISETEIDKNIIPEVRNWNTKKHCFGVSYIGLFNNGQYDHGAMIEYYRRFNVFSIGGGIFGTWNPIKGHNLGFKIGVQYWFSSK